MAECFPEKSSWCWNEHACQGTKSVKGVELSNGLATALYKNTAFLTFSYPLMYPGRCGGAEEPVDARHGPATPPDRGQPVGGVSPGC